jgi:hypothetical protein
VPKMSISAGPRLLPPALASKAPNSQTSPQKQVTGRNQSIIDSDRDSYKIRFGGKVCVIRSANIIRGPKLENSDVSTQATTQSLS